MKILNLVAVGATYFSLAVFAGAMIFTPGSLTVLGWVVFGPMLVGSTAGITAVILSLLPEKKEVSIDEKANVKPATTVVNS